MKDNLLDIPAFLQRGSPENMAAIEDGAARIAANPPPPRPAQRGLNFIKEKKVSNGQRGSKARVTQATRSANDIVRDQLDQLGYSREFIDTVNITKAKAIIADIVAGRGATREDQA